MVVNAEQPSHDWVWVRYLAGHHPYSMVRTSAWSALISEDLDAAVAAFLAPGGGYDQAVERAQQRRARNVDFIRRVYETTTPEYSPEVHSTAKRLLGPNATDVERETFVRTGYEVARSRDRVYRDEVGAQKQALVQKDRDYVRLLSLNDPGEQVRLSAAYAVREGSTDGDVVEFFAYGWATGSRLDLEVFRMRHTSDNMTWRSTIARLIADAEAAEKAAREASQEAKQQAKDAAARAWQQVGTQTQPARSGWSEAQQFAVRQAENWRAVLAAAQAAQGPNWASIIDPATASETAWLAERASAAQQAAYWNALLQQAIDGEHRVKNTL
ncbi:hypothetical protein KIPE111705_46520 [Kibdelosporangium persicum]